MNKVILILSLIFVLGACNDKTAVPKPPTYLRLDLPAHAYSSYKNEDCNYSFDLSEIYKVKPASGISGPSCNKDIDLGPLDGVMFLSYIVMDKPLSEYVNYSINKVDEHKIKASAIEDSSFIKPKDHVYGTFFELQGDVASPFQFYLTDSTSRFVSGVVYLNKTPKYDSLKPSLEYLKIDLYRFIDSFKWND